MPTPILMPALSPTMEVGTLAKWLVKKGDTVKSGDIVAEIETDKATMEVEAVDEGTIGKLLVEEGTADVPVNEPIAMLLEEGESEDDLDGAPSTAPATKPAAATEPESATDKSQAAAETKPGGSASAAPAAPSAGGDRVFASPLARRLAESEGVDLGAVKGTGPHGRIVKRDIEEAKASGSAGKKASPAAAPAGQKAAPPTGAPAGMSDDQIRAMFPDGEFEEIPHDGMRKTIARRLVESKQTIPHFYLTVDVELDALLKVRGEMNGAAPSDKDGKPAYKLSVNDFVIKAMALALRDVPMANATFTSTARLIHKSVDVGVAVSIPDGLITPVIRKADTKTLSAISNEMKDLAKRAREKKLQPSEYQGGSTAVSNLGMFGIKDFSAVINPPHGSILAVGEGSKRAVVKDGALAVATVMTVTLSVDHRAVDGALGAQVLQAFQRLVENPMRLFV
ncbi:pyruvate dehydrogenase complex dihydrolipoamide acetyltransferase [Acuticoccus sp. MNP-M23]|uniref:pyruvate dehydrogenase complex dihydrolipoamide acetyltransferase n=1 Tax=Acuticoccus sp. MNP-M23 TaxID=3072793 RepID=UPI0028157102|nr:pyruvate dehydrogenase complex dihydrolipoamide acetyltransferase [Acuticoccus sp. MNP-M23]WMS42126.1 pyruvate dehydrogenase complex dihydrolipoamide acetyltransferase [Acuticoccus sp. MNP-M23]